MTFINKTKMELIEKMIEKANTEIIFLKYCTFEFYNSKNLYYKRRK